VEEAGLSSGGEEFTILFPNKNAVAVIDYLDLLRMNIESSTFRVRSGQERRKVSRPADRVPAQNAGHRRLRSLLHAVCYGQHRSGAIAPEGLHR